MSWFGVFGDFCEYVYDDISEKSEKKFDIIWDGDDGCNDIDVTDLECL